MADELEAGDVAACVVCGCTEERACRGGCCWVDDSKRPMEDVCSSCVNATCEQRLIPLKEKKMRPCGKVATRKVGEKFYCKTHGTKAAGRAARASA